VVDALTVTAMASAHRESTLTEDWQEAQKRLRERLLACDDNVSRNCPQRGRPYLETMARTLSKQIYSTPPVRAKMTHAVNVRVAKVLNVTFGPRKLADITADEIERFHSRSPASTKAGSKTQGIPRKRSRKPTAVSSGISGSFAVS